MIELPPPDTKHWTARRKAAVVEAVRVAMISLQEACLRYDLSVEEFLAWQRAVERQGLRVKRQEQDLAWVRSLSDAVKHDASAGSLGRTSRIGSDRATHPATIA